MLVQTCRLRRAVSGLLVMAGLGVAALTSLSLPPIAHPGFAVVRLTEPVISRLPKRWPRR